MRRFIFAVAFVLGVAPVAIAGQAGSPAANVGEGGLSMSAALAYIAKDIKNGQKKEMVSRQFFVKGDYGLLPNFDLYVKLGIADMEYDTFKGRLDSLYGAGGKFKLFKDPENRMNVVINGEVTRYRSSDSTTYADVTDYWGAVVIANKIGNVTPYGGLKFSQTEVEFKGATTKLTSDKNVGILAGADYFVNPNVFFNGEVNIFDQQALFIGAGFKF